MIDFSCKVEFIDRFSFKGVHRQVHLHGTCDRFSCKVQFLDRFSFNVVDRQVFMQGTVDRFSCKVQFIDRFSFKADRQVSLARYS